MTISTVFQHGYDEIMMLNRAGRRLAYGIGRKKNFDCTRAQLHVLGFFLSSLWFGVNVLLCVPRSF